MDYKGSLIIEQVNIDSCNNKKSEIVNHLDSLKSNDGVILCLNDTRLSKNKTIKVKGYKTIRCDHPSGKSVPGGVAILHKNEMRVIEISSNLDEMIVTELVHNNKTYRIATVYLHPGHYMTQSHFDAVEKNAPSDAVFIMIGDFNSHCGIDRKRKIDKAGQVLNNLITTNNYRIMNDDSPTYFSRHKSTTSCIDLCLVKCHGSAVSTKWSTTDSVGSDHIITRLDVGCDYTAACKEIISTNWEKVRSELENLNPIVRCGSKCEVDQTLEELGNSIRAVVEKNTKKRKLMTRDNIALSKETNELITFRRKLNKMRKEWDAAGKPTDTTRRVMNNLNREIKKLIKRDVESKTATKIETVWEEKDAAKAWRSLREIEPDIGKKKEDAANSGIFDAHGVLQKEEESLATIHVNRLANAHAFPNDANFDNNFMQSIESEVDSGIPADATDFSRVDEELRNATPESFLETERIGRNGRKLPPAIHDEKITANEIYYFLKKKKNKSAGGEDGITYKILKHAGKNVICNLAKFFTILLVSGYFPISWRSVRISMIPKSNKDLKHAKNWRPISLSSCISKLFESSIKERIEKEKIKRKIKDNELQAAYKQGRNCLEHVVRLSENVTHGFVKGECTVAAFLDVAGAFDKVWVKGLMWKVMKLELPKPLVGVIQGFLTNRSLKVRVGQKISPVIKMEAGTPQGAVLSPTLFNLFVDDLRDIVGLDKSIQLAQYADDIAIWCTCEDPKEAEKKMNEALARIATWTIKWRVRLAPEKSVFMKFSRRPTQRKIPINLKLLGEDVKQVSIHRFLGVNLDDRLAWNEHIKNMLGSAIPRVNALKRLAAKSIWQRPEWILKLHDAVINSIWKYAAIVTCTASKSLFDSITKFHARCVKSYCGIPNCVSYEKVCDTIGIKTIQQELMDFAKKRMKSMIAFSPFGDQIVRNRRSNVTGIYKTPSEVLMDDDDVIPLGQN